MLEGIRQRVATIIKPDVKAEGGNVPMTGLFSFNRPGLPVYSDMTTGKATREGYKISVYVYRAVRTIVQAGAGIPWIATDDEGVRIENSEFEQLMARPNPAMSGQDLMELTIAHLLLCGNAIWQPIRLGNRIKELWPVMPDLVRPIPSGTPGEWLSGWQVTEASGIQREVPPETFIHFMQFDPGNPYWGTGPLMAAARTIDTDNEAQDTQKISMQNRAIPDGVFAHEDVLTPEQFEESTRQIREQRTEKLKRREPWIVGGGTKWQQMSLTPIEMDFIASRLANKRDIAAAFGISPIFLGDLEQSSYNNMREFKRSLYDDATIPMLDDIKATANLSIAPTYGDGVHCAYDLSNIAALREDFGKKTESAVKLWAMGVPFNQINEQLEMGFQEFNGWETSYLPFNVAPAGSGEAAPAIAEEEGKVHPHGDHVCVCPECGYTKTVKVDEKCKEIKCPECGAKMRAEDIGENRGKSINLHTEEQKAAHWKRVDSRRQGYWAVISKKLIPLYKAEGEAVAKAGTDLTAVKKAIAAQRDRWEKTMVATHKVLIEDFGNETARDLQGKSIKAPIRFDPFSAGVRKWITAHVAENVTSILDTNLVDAKAIIATGVSNDLTNVEIARNLRQYYDSQAPFKAMRVARTETAAGASEGQLECFKQFKIKEKTWISSRDDRVRDSHTSLDGESVPIDKTFSNGCTGPGQCGDPAEAIQCRCVLGGEF